MTRARQGLQRIALAMLVGLVAVLCLSSVAMATIIGAATILIVIIDVITHEQPATAPVDPPSRLTVDLSRRD